MVSTPALVKIAIGGGVIVGSAAIIIQTKVRTNFCSQAFYTKPLKILDDYKAGSDILGRPIGVHKVDLSDTANNWTDGLQAKVTIPMTGVRMKGVLHAWSARPDTHSQWAVNKADLEIDGKQWTFYINPAVRDSVKPTQQETADTDDSNLPPAPPAEQEQAQPDAASTSS